MGEWDACLKEMRLSDFFTITEYKDIVGVSDGKDVVQRHPIFRDAGVSDFNDLLDREQAKRKIPYDLLDEFRLVLADEINNLVIYESQKEKNKIHYAEVIGRQFVKWLKDPVNFDYKPEKATVKRLAGIFRTLGILDFLAQNNPKITKSDVAKMLLDAFDIGMSYNAIAERLSGGVKNPLDEPWFIDEIKAKLEKLNFQHFPLDENPLDRRK